MAFTSATVAVDQTERSTLSLAEQLLHLECGSPCRLPEVCTPSARSIRILDGGLPSTAHVMFSDSPSARRRSSICALAVGPSAVSTDAMIRRPSEVPGSKNLLRIRHHIGR